LASGNQIQDTGGKVTHVASNTSSTMRSKSISNKGGQAIFRGLVKITPKADNTQSAVICDSLIMDNESSSDTYPSVKNQNSKSRISHEARVGRIGDEELFYLKNRGFSEEEAVRMIVGGFVGPIIKALPLEYAVELNKLVEISI